MLSEIHGEVDSVDVPAGELTVYEVGDRATVRGLRPDIVVRTGKFGVRGEVSSHVQLLKDGEFFAEYADELLDELAGYFVEILR